MNKEEEKLIDQIAEKESHIEQIKIVEELISSISVELCNLELKTKEVDKIETKLVVNRIYKAATELLESLLTNLLNEKYTSVEILSRVLCEYSVNIIYILKGESIKRSKSLLKNYLNHQARKVRNWNKSHKNKQISCDVSELLAERTPTLQEIMTELLQLKGVENWPNARERFAACNFEEEYITIYGSASETVHSLSEDVFNYVTSHLDVGIDFKVRMKFIELERISFSIYLALNSLRLFLFSSMSISCKKEKDFTPIENVLQKIERLIEVHNKEVHEFYMKN